MQSNSTIPHFHGRIGYTLTLAIVLLTVLPISILVFVIINQVNAQSRQQAVNQLESVTQVKSQEINRWIDTGQDILRLTLNERGEYTQMLALIRENVTPYAIGQLNDYLSQKLDNQSMFTEFFIYDLNGHILTSTNRAQIGKKIAQTTYFKDSLEGNYIQPPFYEVLTGELNMISSQVITDTDGAIIGVLAGRVNLDELSVIMTTREGLQTTGETYLVSLENNYLITPSRFEGYALNRAYRSNGISKGLAGEHGSDFYASYRGIDVIGVYRWLPEIQVAMIAEISQSEALAAGQQVGLSSFVVAVLLTVTSVLFGLAVTRWIVRPIQSLTRTVRKIAEGDYSQRATITRNNEIGQLAYVFNNMTGRLESSITELETNVQQLEQSQKENNRLIRELKDSLVFKDQFLATMSHELRTPLNAILGYSGIALMQGGLPEKAQYMLERVKANSNRLLSLINDILDISRINAGGVEIVSRPINVYDMVKGWYADGEQTKRQLGKTDIDFDLEYDPNLPPEIIGDEERISQITNNLLTNAFKFTESGKVKLAVRFKDESKWVISVTDSGPGIPETWQHLIFDEFRQVDGTSKRKHGGAGLGLSIVKKLCLLMGGTVTLSSKLGEGSTFTVTLPMEIAAVNVVA